MKKLSFILTAGILLFCSYTGNSQALLKNIANKARQKVIQRTEESVEQKAEERVNQKIDEELDKSVATDSTKVSPQSQSEKTNQRMNKLMSGLGLDATPVKYETNYSFSANIKMDMENYDAKGKLTTKGKFNIFFNDDNSAFAYEILAEDGQGTGQGMMIFDTKNKVSIILSDKDGQKSGIVTGINFSLDDSTKAALNKMDNNSTDISSLNQNITKTGRTKTILGYSCDEYIYKDEETHSEVWLTKEKVWQTTNLFRSINKGVQYSGAYPQGFWMETDSKDLKTNERSVMKVTEINDKASKKFDLSGYQMVNMGSLNMNKK